MWAYELGAEVFRYVWGFFEGAHVRPTLRPLWAHVKRSMSCSVLTFFFALHVAEDTNSPQYRCIKSMQNTKAKLVFFNHSNDSNVILQSWAQCDFQDHQKYKERFSAMAFKLSGSDFKF